jgi:aminopeptidase N
MNVRFRGSRRLFCALLLCCAPAWGRRAETVPATWKPTHYEVFLEFDRELSTLMSAKTVITVEQTEANRRLELDFGKLPVLRVRMGGVPLEFSQTGEKLRVELPPGLAQTFSVSVEYAGKPEDGLIFARDADGRPTVIGDNWPNRLHHWVPCVDQPSAKATVNFSVRAPGVVVGNGALAERVGDVWRYAERVPIPPYCMVVAVGSFARTPRPAVVDLSTYVAGSQVGWAQEGFSTANATVDFLQRRVAPFPYEKLALIVGATRFGGMENASAIVFNPRIVGLARERVESLVAHEIAHQWFGDSVTPADWSELWLSEGFATYFAGLFLRERAGEPVFRDYMRRGAELYFAGVPHLPLHDEDTEPLVKLLNANSYQKGAWVLHMLRGEVGEQAFWAGVRAYFAEHRNGTATSEDLRAAMEGACGRSLERFFGAWVYGAGHPLTQLRWSWRDGRVRMRLEQLQSGEPFPVRVTVGVGGRRVVFAEGRGEAWVENVERGAQVVLDPERDVLMEGSVVEER